MSIHEPHRLTAELRAAYVAQANDSGVAPDLRHYAISRLRADGYCDPLALGDFDDFVEVSARPPAPSQPVTSSSLLSVEDDHEGSGSLGTSPAAASQVEDVSPVSRTWSRDEVIAYLEGEVPEIADLGCDDVRWLVTADTYELREVDPRSLPLLHGLRRTGRFSVDDYAARPTRPPHIVLMPDGTIGDGNHRVAAALLKGDEHVLAFVPMSACSITPAQHVGALSMTFDPSAQ